MENDKRLEKKYGKAYYTQMVNRMQKVKEESEPDRYGYCDMTDCNNNATWLYNGRCEDCQG